MMIIQQPCHGCNGKKVVLVGCKDCGGTGQRDVKERVSISLPPGVQNGHTEILKGKGMPRGDLWVIYDVQYRAEFSNEMREKIKIILHE